jgi:hypothetical protein
MRLTSPLLAAFSLLSATRAAEDDFPSADDILQAEQVPIVDAHAQAQAQTPASDPLAQIKEPFQQLLSKVVAYTGYPHYYDAEDAAAIKEGPTGMTVLTLQNWRDTLYKPVYTRNADASGPEEWWVFFSGGNKTCYGKCDQVTVAWNETAAKLTQLPEAPHLGYVNCELQPVLCSAWGAGTGSVWAIEMLPPPADIEIYRKRLNLTTTTSDDIMALYEAGSKAGWVRDEGNFHPFKGFLAQKGLAVPYGYAMWALNILPQWAFMLIMSLASRTLMARRMGDRVNRPQAPAQ